MEESTNSVLESILYIYFVTLKDVFFHSGEILVIWPTLRSARSRWRLRGGEVTILQKRDKQLLQRQRYEGSREKYTRWGMGRGNRKGFGYHLILTLLHSHKAYEPYNLLVKPYTSSYVDIHDHWDKKRRQLINLCMDRKHHSVYV